MCGGAGRGGRGVGVVAGPRWRRGTRPRCRWRGRRLTRRSYRGLSRPGLALSAQPLRVSASSHAGTPAMRALRAAPQTTRRNAGFSTYTAERGSADREIGDRFSLSFGHERERAGISYQPGLIADAARCAVRSSRDRSHNRRRRSRRLCRCQRRPHSAPALPPVAEPPCEPTLKPPLSGRDRRPRGLYRPSG